MLFILICDGYFQNWCLKKVPSGNKAFSVEIELVVEMVADLGKNMKLFDVRNH